MTVVVEVANRSGWPIDPDEVEILTRNVLRTEDLEHGDVGVAFVSPDEIRALKREHLGIDEVTDVLSFPIDALDRVPVELPRQLGDVVVCPQFVDGKWRQPLIHGLLHLLGHEHGHRMTALERSLGE
jgi:rRNA maturation RNase YbeY